MRLVRDSNTIIIESLFNMANYEVGWKPVERFFKLLAVDRKDILYIYVFAIFAGIINLTVPVGVQAIINFIGGGQFVSSWWILVLVVVSGTLLAGILKIFQFILAEIIQQRLFARSALEFSYRIPRFRLEPLLEKYPPELMNRFFDTLTLQKGLSKILLDFSAAGLEVIFGLLLISFYHSVFVTFSVVLLVVLFFIFYFTGYRGLKTSLKESSYKYEVAHWLEELARTVTTFKQAGQSTLPLQRTDELVSHYIGARRNHFKILLFQYSSAVIFKVLTVGSLLVIGSFLVVNNQINIGQFVAAEIVILLITSSIEKLLASMDTIYDVLTSLEKIGSVTDLPLEDERGLDFHTIDTPNGMCIEIKDLNYTFPGNNKPSLSHISLAVNAGERVCIAGYSGSGRSTLINILSGYYRDYKGSLTFNGIPLVNINLGSLQQRIGEISELEDLFKGTLYDNIALGLSHVTLQDVKNAVKVAGLESFVNGHPDGYYRPVFPAGRTFSQSVIRKILVARSICHNPSLILLSDNLEALSAGDKNQILDYLFARPQAFSVLAATNDAEIASRCDKVIILQEGEIIAQDTYENLIQTEVGKSLFNL